MKYTQSQWDKEIGWGKVPEKYKYKNKLEEYTRKIKLRYLGRCRSCARYHL